MHRRLMVLVLALFIAGAPQALALCHIACAAIGTTGAGEAGHKGHSSLHRSVSVTAVVDAAPDVCGYVNELPKAEAQSQVTVPVAIVATELAPPLWLEAAPPLDALRQSPPGPLRLPAPLRI